MHTTLVTGGAGFIGSHLVEALLERGRRVIVLDDLSTGSLDNLRAVQDHPNLRIEVGNVNEQAQLAELVALADDVYHLAAVVGVRLVMDHPEQTVTTNLAPFASLLHLLRLQPKPLFLASTSEVYGKNPKPAFSEDDDLVLGPPTRRRWVYACSKALDEYLALAQHQRTGLPVVIARLFNVVGPRQTGRYGMVLPIFVDQALAGGPLTVHEKGEQVRCFAHVRDVVAAICKLMETPSAFGRVFNLGSDTPVTIRSLAEQVVRAVDPAIPIQYVPYSTAFDPGFEDVPSRIPDLTRIREAINYTPTRTLTEIIREVIAWRRGP
jgi:UDP-glucose 4-epimerase